MIWRLAVVLIGLFQGFVSAQASVLMLKDGRIIERPSMERTESGVRVNFENGAVDVPGALILEAILPNDRSFVPETPEEQEKVAAGFVLYEGKWVQPARRDLLVAKRLEEHHAAIAEMKKTREWRDRIKETTDHFNFEATVPKHIFEDYRDLMETYFSAFLKEWGIKQPRDLGRLTVCFYIDREAYMQVSGAGPNVLGYFRFVEPLELNFYFDRTDPLATEEVMFHETNHYLQKLIDPDFMYPHFPGEALAEYYGASSWDPVKKKLESGLVLEGRLIEVHQDIARGEYVGLKQILEQGPDRTYTDYTWGWSLVHFLMNQPEYAKKFKSWYVALAKGKDVERYKADGYNMYAITGETLLSSFKKYLGIKNDEALQKLEQEWYTYIKEALQVTSLRGIEDAAYSAWRRDRNIKAKNLFKQAVERDTKNALTYYRFANLLDEENEDPALRIAYWRRAIELDPLSAEFYIPLAMELITKAETKEEGRRLLKLALEIDPENYWLERNLERLVKS